MKHPVEQFDTINQALAFAVENYVAKQRGYIINILGPDDAETGKAATLQVVARAMITGDGDPGLAMHLPFDPQSGDTDAFVRLLEAELATPLSEYDFRGIPCYYASFGTEVERAERAILQVLVLVYGNSPSATFVCEVHDEGPLADATGFRSPPGGCIWPPPSE